MTRKGKTARLPHPLRTELNLRLAIVANPVAATTKPDLAEHLAAVLAGRFATLPTGWDGTEDNPFDAKRHVLTRFNRNLALLRPSLSAGFPPDPVSLRKLAAGKTR
jgi:hypothetical protein